MAKTYIDGNGYRRFSDSDKSVHSWVAEKKVGGSLWPGTEVHHKNRDKLDNSRDNLWAFSSKSEHQKTHREEGW